MRKAITIAQIVVSVLMIASILLQQRGVGLGATFGGDGAAFRTKRGLEKGLFYATIVLSVLFLGLGLALIIVSK
ncbi:MAG TPA: preprotein translocase subunit SecG [Candidatus Baltobacteraceae bacterium]|nr:preprotein translocase subunit SecG [Candidatus Baltobacteraceae bacterium]